MAAEAPEDGNSVDSCWVTGQPWLTNLGTLGKAPADARLFMNKRLIGTYCSVQYGYTSIVYHQSYNERGVLAQEPGTCTQRLELNHC